MAESSGSKIKRKRGVGNVGEVHHLGGEKRWWGGVEVWFGMWAVEGVWWGL